MDGPSFDDLDNASLLTSLRRGDEGAFTWLVQQYHNSLVRLALNYVRGHAIAEEVAQETWIAVLKGLSRFEGRSSVKTWIFTILTNRAKTRGQREKRSLPFSELDTAFENQPTVDPERFNPLNFPTFPGHWALKPASWENIPEQIMLSQELLNVVRKAVSELPPGQQAVIELSDIEGFSSNDVCNILGISETNQRVLLHRARAKVRKALDDYLKIEN